MLLARLLGCTPPLLGALALCSCTPASPSAATSGKVTHSPAEPVWPAETPATVPPRATRPQGEWREVPEVTCRTFTGAVVVAEIRPVKVVDLLTDAETEGPTSLIVRVRFSNTDDTLNAGSPLFRAPKVTDEFGNTYEAHVFPANARSGEPHEDTDLTPGKPATWVFVFKQPVPQATRFRFTVTGSLRGVQAEDYTFPFAITLPKPEK